MQAIAQYFRKKREAHAVKAEKNAKKVVLNEIFNDLYNNRKRIYRLNFIRGIVFGAGSALGGTLVIALIVWTLSLFVNAPLVGELFKNAQDSIRQTTVDSTRKVTD